MAAKVKNKKQNSGKPSPSTADPHDAVFKALANADRRGILDLLRDAPCTTGQICAQFDRLDRCTVMLHLKALEQAGLIITKKKGRQRWNYLDCVPIQRAYRRWIKRYAEPAASLLDRLKREIEEE